MCHASHYNNEIITSVIAIKASQKINYYYFSYSYIIFFRRFNNLDPHLVLTVFEITAMINESERWLYLLIVSQQSSCTAFIIMKIITDFRKNAELHEITKYHVQSNFNGWGKFNYYMFSHITKKYAPYEISLLYTLWLRIITLTILWKNCRIGSSSSECTVWFWSNRSVHTRTVNSPLNAI